MHHGTRLVSATLGTWPCRLGEEEDEGRWQAGRTFLPQISTSVCCQLNDDHRSMAGRTKPRQRNGRRSTRTSTRLKRTRQPRQKKLQPPKKKQTLHQQTRPFIQLLLEHRLQMGRIMRIPRSGKDQQPRRRRREQSERRGSTRKRRRRKEDDPKRMAKMEVAT